MRPHLVRWQEDYAEQGLFVIEISGGEQEPLNVVKEIVEKQRLNHPVLWDWKCRNHDNYGLKNWPVAYLVDKQGKVFWEGNPAQVVNRSTASTALRKLIESELAEGGTTANSEHLQSLVFAIIALAGLLVIGHKTITVATRIAVLITTGWAKADVSTRSGSTDRQLAAHKACR